LLDSLIAFARDDWAGVLAHSGGVPHLEFFALRALGELGRVEEMTAAFAAWQPYVRGRELALWRLMVLACAGRIGGVHAMLRRQARFLRPDRAAYWSFVAASTAGVADESRSALAHAADASDDESFRRTAQRRLAAALPEAGPALSPPAAAVIAAIEAAAGHRTL
jgi:hypothetical protein